MKYLEKCPRLDCRSLREATLNKNFTLDCIKYAKDNGTRDFDTYSRFQTQQRLRKKIIDAGIDWITISIDGTDETYNGEWQTSEIR